MNHFPENLARLRREAGHTQESLAEALNVSRQAVSKWESGQAMPEAATLVELADLLGCTLDQLVRQELGDALPAAPEEVGWASGEAQSQAVFHAWCAHMDRFSLMIAGGVALVLLGAAGVLLACALLGEGPLTALPIFPFLIAAVGLFVWGGISHRDFEARNPEVPMLWTDEERDAFGRQFRLAITLGVVGVLADAALMVFLGWWAGKSESRQLLSTALFMVILAVCVWAFVYFGIQSKKMEGPDPQKKSREDNPLAAAIMLTATAAYLLMGFLLNLWHPGWIVFPLGGILCGILEQFQRK